MTNVPSTACPDTKTSTTSSGKWVLMPFEVSDAGTLLNYLKA